MINVLLVSRKVWNEKCASDSNLVERFFDTARRTPDMKDISDMLRQRTRKCPRSNHWKKEHEDAIHCAPYRTIDIWPFDICMYNKLFRTVFFIYAYCLPTISAPPKFRRCKSENQLNTSNGFIPPNKTNNAINPNPLTIWTNKSLWRWTKIQG